jgi:hypothetical protein
MFNKIFYKGKVFVNVIDVWREDFSKSLRVITKVSQPEVECLTKTFNSDSILIWYRYHINGYNFEQQTVAYVSRCFQTSQSGSSHIFTGDQKLGGYQRENLSTHGNCN